MRASIRLNNDVPPRRLTAIAALAEELGFDQLWVSHDLFWRSAPVMLATALHHTSRIHLGIGVANPASAHPAEIAMHAATLQEVSDGRFLLGLGAGADEFLGWAGIDPGPPAVPRTRRAVLAIRALLAGERPADVPGLDGGWGRQAYLRAGPRPVPIYVGGMGPRMLRLAGEVADGALPLLYPPEHFATAAGQIEHGARAAGRDPREIDLAACVWCSIDPNPARAARALAEKIAYYGASFAPSLLRRAGLRPEDFAPVRRAMAERDLERAVSLVTPAMLGLGIAGDAEELERRCRGLLAAGATHLSFGPPIAADPLEGVRRIGRDVLPRLRATSDGVTPPAGAPAAPRARP
jgi:5,10-methylenetetrahydromethanopterin reductase